MNQLLELGPEHIQTLYGLLDIEKNFFYQVHHDRTAIEFLHDLSSNHRRVISVPVHACGNWHRNIIDNTNCVNWGIDAFWPEMRERCLIDVSTSLVENHNQPTSDLLVLSQRLNLVLRTLFHKLPVSDQEFDYRPDVATLLMFADDAWVNQAVQIETQHNQHWHDLYQVYMQQLRQLIKNTDIMQPNYCEILDQLTKKFCLSIDADFFIRKDLCLI